tara:strand:+ start:729 stop:914 length:186 start_codon:yes stop_codon:yes gene_type:complete
VNLLKIAILVCGFAIIVLSYVIFQQQVMINNLYADWNEIMELIILWLQDKGMTIPETQVEI